MDGEEGRQGEEAVKEFAASGEECPAEAGDEASPASGEDKDDADEYEGDDESDSEDEWSEDENLFGGEEITPGEMDEILKSTKTRLELYEADVEEEDAGRTEPARETEGKEETKKSGDNPDEG